MPKAFDVEDPLTIKDQSDNHEDMEWNVPKRFEDFKAVT